VAAPIDRLDRPQASSEVDLVNQLAPPGLDTLVLMSEDRFVLLLDILGFKQLVATKSLHFIREKIEGLLDECESWAAGRSDTDFDTIHFSDTVLIYTRGTGAYKEWYDDMVFIGSRICSKMFADGLPVRGALSYGSFLVEESGRHKIYLGQALIDAHETAEPKSAGSDRDFMGFKVTPNTWRTIYPGLTNKDAFREFGWGVLQSDDTLWINFFQELQGDDPRQIAFEFEEDLRYPERTDNPWPIHELNAFRHIRSTANLYVRQPEHPIARKYLKTMSFIREVLGERLYETVDALADESIGVEASSEDLQGPLGAEHGR
jgi:hypothetical protein